MQTAAHEAGVEVICGAKVVSVTTTIINAVNDDDYTATNVDSNGQEQHQAHQQHCQYRISYQLSQMDRTTSYNKDGDITIDNAAVNDDDVNIQEQQKSHAEVQHIDCDKLIMATGSSRLGYEMLKGLGHTMQAPLPSLFSFKIQVNSAFITLFTSLSSCIHGF